MPLVDKTDELKRLIKVFEAEAEKFYPLTFSLLYVTQDSLSFNRPIGHPNHAVMLWQYYGTIHGAPGTAEFAKDISDSNLKWGIRGAELTCFAILEGEGCELFVRMAQRAGAMFDEEEGRALESRVVQEILEAESNRQPHAKPAAISNSNPLALWLNYLLFHLSLTNPGRDKTQQINPDPFTLSLIALERLYVDRSIDKVDRSARPLSALRFKVAMSFPSERRQYVSATVAALRPQLPLDSIFYDYDYQAQLAKPNLDILLQDIYRNRANLIVIFLCEKYGEKEWCGLEWRAIRELIKQKNDDQIMFVRFDDALIDGVLSLDGYVDARIHSPQELANFILQRIETSMS